MYDISDSGVGSDVLNRTCQMNAYISDRTDSPGGSYTVTSVSPLFSPLGLPNVVIL